MVKTKTKKEQRKDMRKKESERTGKKITIGTYQSIFPHRTIRLEVFALVIEKK